jgi:hypothetical protein
MTPLALTLYRRSVMISRRVISVGTEVVGSGALIVVLGALLFGLTRVNAQTAPAGGGDIGQVAKPDQKSEEIDVQVVALRYAEAARSAEIVKNIFNDVAGKPGDGAAAAQGTKLRLLVSADERTNSLVLRGPRELLQTATAVLTQLDVAPPPAPERAANQKQPPASNEARLQKLEAGLVDLLNEIKALREEMHRTPTPAGERAK